MDTLLTFRDLVEIFALYAGFRIMSIALAPHVTRAIKRIRLRIAIRRCFKQRDRRWVYEQFKVK